MFSTRGNGPMKFQLMSTVKWVLGVSGGDLAVFDSSTWWLGTLRTNYRKHLCHFLTWATRIGPSRNCQLCVSPCALLCGGPGLLQVRSISSPEIRCAGYTVYEFPRWASNRSSPPRL